MKAQVIAADPPWRYSNRASNGAVEKKTKFGSGVHGHYGTMEDDQIKALGERVNAIADDNSILFLWVTGPRLDLGIEVLKLWGFRYASIGFVWVKITKIMMDVYKALREIATNRLKSWYKKIPPPDLEEFLDRLSDTNPGNYTASNVELMLIGVKGSMEPSKKMIRQVVFARKTKHSQKPEKFQDRIELMFPDAVKVEMFARRPRDGWICLGNEIDGLDIREALDNVRAMP